MSLQGGSGLISSAGSHRTARRAKPGASELASVSNLRLVFLGQNQIMAGRRTLSAVAAAISLAALASAQAPLGFPAPGATPEAVADSQDFPYLPALPATKLISTRLINEPLELRPATADSEAVLAGMSYIQKTYQPPAGLASSLFIATFRDALIAAGWRLIGGTKLEEAATQQETVNVAAYYSANGRIIFARLSQQPDGPYQVNVADVGDEDWSAALATDCPRAALQHPVRSGSAVPAPRSHADTGETRRAAQGQVGTSSGNPGPHRQHRRGGRCRAQALSEARAKAVMAWLVEHGVPAATLSSKGYGKTRPVAANDSDLGRAMNRRIEIVTTGCSR